MFVKWVSSGITINDLVFFENNGRSSVSSATLLRYFYQFLDKPPLPKRQRSLRRSQVYLKIDGSYFKRWGCILVYKADKRIIYWSFVARENYFSFCTDLAGIESLGYQIKGITSDRNGSLVSVIKNFFPEIPHQFCLVHLQRNCQSLLTQNPQTKAGKELLELILFLNRITNHYQRDIWLKWFGRLTQRHEALIRERTYGKDEVSGRRTWWYTHKNLRRAFRTLHASRENLFLYLDYPDLPKDNNGLEAEFSHLKGKLNIHRGLTRERRTSFVKWYFYLKSINKTT